MTRRFQRAQETTAARGTPSPATERMSFIRGVMYINQVAQNMVRWIHRLSSNGTTRYAAIEWADPVDDSRRFSCNCPGWANRRTCKHIVELQSNESLGQLADVGEGQAIDLPATVTATPKVVEHQSEDGRSYRAFSF